jgi:hypothetical protein
MKNAIKLIGFIALAAVIGFSFTACGDGGGGGSQSSSKTAPNKSITITGLGAYNGGWANIVLMSGNYGEL